MDVVAVAATTQGNATVVLPAGPAAIDAQALAAAQPDAVRTQSSAAAGAQVARVGNPNQTIIEYKNLGSLGLGLLCHTRSRFECSS